MVINALPIKLTELGVYVVGYADYVAFVVEGDKSQVMNMRIQRALNLNENTF